jgi:ribosome-binding protein aMBF1 (putative translation factor)
MKALPAFTIPDMLPAAIPPTPPSEARKKQIIERIGLVIRTVRKTRGYSLAEVETMSGVSASTVQRIETGTSEPGAATLVALETALDLRPGWVIATAA